MTARHELQVEMKKKENDFEEKIQNLLQEKETVAAEKQRITSENQNLEINSSLLNDEVMINGTNKLITLEEHAISVFKPSVPRIIKWNKKYCCCLGERIG